MHVCVFDKQGVDMQGRAGLVTMYVHGDLGACLLDIYSVCVIVLKSDNLEVSQTGGGPHCGRGPHSSCPLLWEGVHGLSGQLSKAEGSQCAINRPSNVPRAPERGRECSPFWGQGN